MPGRLSFLTTADGSNSPTERMRINQKGSVGIGVADGDVTNDGTAARTYVGIIGTANRGRLNLGCTASNGADAGTLAFTNGTNSLAELVVDTHSGVQNAGDFTLDVTGDIVFDADGGDFNFKDGGTTLLSLSNAGSNNVQFLTGISDGDLLFKGVDGGSVITALTLDMSEAGDATFNAGVGVGGASPGSSALVVKADTDKIMRFNSAIGETGNVITIQGTNDDGTSMVGIGLAGSSIVLERGPVTINDNGGDHDFRVESENNANMLFLDAGNDVVNIGGVTVETGDQLSVHGSGTNTIQRIYNTNAGTGGSMLIFQKQSSSPANDDNLGDIRFHGNDAAGNLHQYGRILCNSSNVTNGSEQGQLFIQTSFGGSATDVLKLGADAIFNEGGNDIGFRIESDNDANCFVVDAGNDRVIVGASAATAGTDFVSFDARPGSTGQLIQCGRDDASTKNQIIFTNPNGTVGSVQTSGTATAFNTSSDERLKENITDAEDAGAKVDGIKVRQFDWKTDGAHQDYGMVAQELNEVAPEAVSQGENEDEMWAVDYSKLVPMLVKEIQSLRKRVAELEGG
jgi:hypothetical protein